MSSEERFERKKFALFLFFELLQIHFLLLFRQPKARVLLLKGNKLKPYKQSLKQHKTARRYRSANVNDLDLKTCEINTDIL